MSTAKQTTVEKATELAQGLLTEMGLSLWDVTFAKEGSVWVLCYLLDKEGGITIDDCEQFSRAIDKLLDESDPIEQNYTLEVSSPGVERELCRDWHFESCMGELVSVRLIRPVEGVRDFVGTLTGYADGMVTLLLDEESEMQVNRNETAFIRLYYEF